VLAEASDPQLTTVRQPLEELGVQAVAALRAAIGTGLRQPQSAVLTAEIVVRASTRPPVPGAGGDSPGAPGQ
jgi:DNA-binding LacI/PurR family transcriptional regulator